MYSYQISQRNFSSEFEIPYLLSNSVAAQRDFNVILGTPQLPEINPYNSWLNPDLTPRLNFYRQAQSFYLEYPEIINFQIKDKTIICEQKVLDEYHFLHLLTDQVIPLFFSQTELLIHASAYSYQNYNIILLGKSGSGKSTLVNKLYPLGKFIGDDFLVVNLQKNEPEIIPSYPGIRLFNDQHDKSISAVPADYFQTENRLKKNIIVCLQRSDNHQRHDYCLTSPAAEEVYAQLLSEIINIEPQEQLHQIKLFAELNDLINRSKVLTLAYHDISEVDFRLLNNRIIESF